MLLFKPRGDMNPPATYGLQGYEQVALKTADGLQLKAWYSKPQGAKKAVIYFIGNTDNLKNYVEFFTQLRAANIAVLGVCYRGYCGNAGAPTEQGLYADADAALALVEKDFADKDITAIGRSLGSGVATNLAHKKALGGLVLISPYTSIPDVAADMYWYVPVRWLIRDRFESIDKIAAVESPILILHGDADRLIPLAQSEKLLSKAVAPHRLKIYKGYAHHDMPFDRIGVDVIDFVRKQK